MHVTLERVARRAGVARNTASAILNNRSDSWASAATRERVFQAASELGYRANQAAIGLRTGRYQTAGVLAPDLLNPFYAGLVEAVANAFEGKGYRVLVEDSRGSFEREKAALKRLAEANVDGLICFLMDAPAHRKILEEQVRRGRAVVYMGDYDPKSCAHHVGLDFDKGLVAAVAHLADLGHHRIGFVQPLGQGQRPRSLRLFRQAMEACGLKFNPRLFVRCCHTVGDAFSAFGAAMDRWSPANRPTAVVALNDITAMGVLRAALDRNLRVPDDLALVTMDNTYLAEYMPIRLTAIVHPFRELGLAAVDSFLQSGRGEPLEQRILVPAGLIVRESSGGKTAPSSRSERSGAQASCRPS